MLQDRFPLTREDLDRVWGVLLPLGTGSVPVVASPGSTQDRLDLEFGLVKTPPTGIVTGQATLRIAPAETRVGCPPRSRRRRVTPVEDLDSTWASRPLRTAVPEKRATAPPATAAPPRRPRPRRAVWIGAAMPPGCCWRSPQAGSGGRGGPCRKQSPRLRPRWSRRRSPRRSRRSPSLPSPLRSLPRRSNRRSPRPRPFGPSAGAPCRRSAAPETPRPAEPMTAGGSDPRRPAGRPAAGDPGSAVLPLSGSGEGERQEGHGPRRRAGGRDRPGDRRPAPRSRQVGPRLQRGRPGGGEKGALLSGVAGRRRGEDVDRSGVRFRGEGSRVQDATDPSSTKGPNRLSSGAWSFSFFGVEGGVADPAAAPP